MSEPMHEKALPAWLVAPQAYEPLRDRDGFLRRNLLALASALTALRAEPDEGAESALGRQLAQVRPSLRLAGAVLLAVLVGLARNLAFVWVVLVGWMVLLAMQPASRIRACLLPALAVAGIALVVNLPALLLGQSAAPVRMASKSLVTVGVVMGLASSLGADGLLRALRGLHLPARACMVVDLAVRDVVLLGEAATSLSEALALRSVGQDRAKTASAAGVMGAVFVRAQGLASARAEAMELRGYDGTVPATSRGKAVVPQEAAYVAALLALIGLFVYLEMSLA